MSIRIDQNTAGQLGAGMASGQSSAQTGRLQGVPVQVRDEASILADAAEEMSFYRSQAKAESKTHADRSVRASERQRVMSIAQINAYLDKAKAGGDPKELVALAKRMLQADQNPGQIARHSQHFKTPTEQYLLLQYARELGPGEGASPAALERIEDAIAGLEAWFGKAIQTNLATIEQAGQFGNTAQEVRDFQDSIHVVLGKPSLAQALQEVMHLAGQAGGKLEAAITHLMGALGACLAATSSAAERALLQTLVTDLYHLKALRSLLDDCKKLVRTLKKQAQAAKGGVRSEHRRVEGRPQGDQGQGDAEH